MSELLISRASLVKALVKTAYGPGNIDIQEVSKPELPAEDWVLIKVKAAGVCGTDLHIWHDEFTYYPPVILGHEFAGVVEKVGASVTDFFPGERVVGEPHTKFCGRCFLCRTGRVQLCKSKRSPGWGINGAFADYITMPAVLLHRIPDTVPFEIAALTEPLAVVVHQITERVRLEPQDFVVITGSGPIGLLAAFAAKQSGAAKVMITGLSSGEKLRFKIAKELGADYAINVDKVEPVQKILELTGGVGADLVIETSGAPQAIAQSAQLVRTCGRMSMIGFPKEELTPIFYRTAMLKSLDVHFNMSSSYTSWIKALRLLERVGERLWPMVSILESLEDWETVFRAMELEENVKPVFVF